MIIELKEYETQSLSQAILSPSLGEQLWRDYDARSGQLHVEEPSFRNQQQWQITSQGWVGMIPLTADLHLHLLPKTPIHNLFRMLEYAYQLQSFQLLDGLTGLSSLDEFYERLAHILAQKVKQRAQQGLHHSYIPQRQSLPYVRGRLQQSWPQPWQTAVPCHYAHFTADIPDNQILAYTLRRIALSHVCGGGVQTAVRQAYRAVKGAVSEMEVSVSEVINRFYTRLNQDYQPMHALCRFFLEHTGPSHQVGDHEMIPFLVNMARLYELFVAEWLKANLPPPWRVKAQEKLHIGPHNELQFEIDLVIEDSAGKARYVLDTKYKTAAKPAPADINQIIAYATAKNCPNAILIYPAPLSQPLNIHLDNIHIRTLPFSLANDLEGAGNNFLNGLFQ
ncbi:MAG: restriction endonuclease [Ardenticatenaceae bacterium]|nr:restriction endonuclease [Ardenticatenaceae bacterium]